MSAMPERDVRQAPRERLTYDDLVRMPDDGLRHELIDGEHYVTPAPRLRHQRIVSNVSYALQRHVRTQGGGWVLAEPGVIIDQSNVVEPDIVYLTPAQVQRVRIDADLDIAPALVIEVSSASTRKYDATIKRALYETIGVTEYWIVDVPTSSVSVYRRSSTGSAFNEPMVLHVPGDLVTTELMPGLRLHLTDIFDIRRG